MFYVYMVCVYICIIKNFGQHIDIICLLTPLYWYWYYPYHGSE